MLVFRVLTVTVIDLLLLLLGEVPVPVLVRKVVCSEQIYRGLLRFLKVNSLSQSQNELRPLFSIDFSIKNSQTFSHAFLTTQAAEKHDLSRLKSKTKKLTVSPSFLKINKNNLGGSFRKENKTLRLEMYFLLLQVYILCK